MLLEHKNAIVYGGGRSVGGAVAHTFAREGAKVFLAGRTRESLDALGKAATFMAPDGAGPMTATFANITCGANLD
jgi:NAD(P)-dependent dehydrogenase (short-subunit alcohol dehydrogenase family)